MKLVTLSALLIAPFIVMAPSASAQSHYVRPEFEKATCVKVDGGPNGIPSLTWDFALHVDQNDANRSDLTYRYRVYNLNVQTDRLIYNDTDSTATERITFPNTGRYSVFGYVIDSANDTVDVCSRQITVIGPDATTTAPAPTTNNTNPTPAPTQQNNNTSDDEDTSNNEDDAVETDDEVNTTTEVVATNDNDDTAVVSDDTNEKTSATPEELPNTGMSPVALFGATSVVGYAIDLLRRRFF